MVASSNLVTQIKNERASFEGARFIFISEKIMYNHNIIFIKRG